VPQPKPGAAAPAAIITGALITAIGLAALAGALPAIADYSYAIVWWGVLLLVDSVNTARRGLSLFFENLPHLITITLPISVLVWLAFEALNFPAAQWRYRGDIPGIWPKVIFGFVAFSTVIPIMVESWWLVGGRQCVPRNVLRSFRNYRSLSFAAAAVFAVMPFVNDVLWLNQGIWLVPGLLLLPFVSAEHCSAGAFIRALVLSALLAGLCWESFNYPARTHWEYLILPDAPHLFYMPIPGYLGFIPFAMSMLAVYEVQLHVRPTIYAGVLLYGTAITGLYWLTRLYIENGLWLQSR
jgi:hypothetical protein